MTNFVFSNFYDTTLASGLSSSSTTVTVASSAGLPALAAGQVLPMILNDAATRAVHEVIYVTSISGSVLTVLRGQEGTAIASWLTGDYIYADVTQATVAPVNGSPNNPFVVSNLTAATGVFNNIAVFLTSGATVNGAALGWTNGGNWAIPSGVSVIRVRGWGGGGGGGGSLATTFAGSGGGGAAYSEAIFRVLPGTNYAVSVGPGGAGGQNTSGNTQGVAGATSFFGSLMTAGGGNAGIGQSTGSTFETVGGTATGGNINMPGGWGGVVFPNSATANGAFGGTGGASPMGGQGGVGSYGTASNGLFPGGGGGGGGTGNGAFNGGTGANGMIVVEY